MLTRSGRSERDAARGLETERADVGGPPDHLGAVDGRPARPPEQGAQLGGAATAHGAGPQRVPQPFHAVVATAHRTEKGPTRDLKAVAHDLVVAAGARLRLEVEDSRRAKGLDLCRAQRFALEHHPVQVPKLRPGTAHGHLDQPAVDEPQLPLDVVRLAAVAQHLRPLSSAARQGEMIDLLADDVGGDGGGAVGEAIHRRDRREPQELPCMLRHEPASGHRIDALEGPDVLPELR